MSFFFRFFPSRYLSVLATKKLASRHYNNKKKSAGCRFVARGLPDHHHRIGSIFPTNRPPPTATPTGKHYFWVPPGIHVEQPHDARTSTRTYTHKALGMALREHWVSLFLFSSGAHGRDRIQTKHIIHHLLCIASEASGRMEWTNNNCMDRKLGGVFFIFSRLA